MLLAVVMGLGPVAAQIPYAMLAGILIKVGIDIDVQVKVIVQDVLGCAAELIAMERLAVASTDGGNAVLTLTPH